MTNVIPMPGLAVEAELSEIEGIVDAMLYMHESAAAGDYERIILCETTLLHVIKDKCRVGHRQLERMPGHYGRRAG